MFLAAGVSVPGCCQTETLTLPPEQFVLPCARAEPGCSPVPEWCWWLCRAELATAVGPTLISTPVPPPAWHQVLRWLWWHLPDPGMVPVPHSWCQSGYLILVPGHIRAESFRSLGHFRSIIIPL